MSENHGTFVAVFVALLAFVGAIFGTVLGGFFGHWQSRSEMVYQDYRTVLDKRVELIEATSVVFNKAALAALLDSSIHLRSRIADPSAAFGDAAANTSGTLIPDPDVDLEKRCRDMFGSNIDLIALNTEYASTMQLNALFFGPETRQALRDLISAGDWWEVDDSLHTAVMRAMFDEIRLGMEYFDR